MKKDYTKYNLSVTQEMNKKYSFFGKRILDIGCGDGDMVKIIANNYLPRHITGVDKYLRSSQEEKDNYSLLDGIDAKVLPFEDESFDFVYSISTFEHIEGIDSVLSEIKRVLKPGGKFYSDFAPIWTSVAGHHVYCVENAIRQGEHHDEEVVNAIPPWGHLFMDKEEMQEHLEHTNIPVERREAILNYIYDSRDINRYTASELKHFLFQSGMIIRKYCELVTFSRQWALDKKGTSELSPAILNRIKRTDYEISDIGIVSMNIELEKYESIE